MPPRLSSTAAPRRPRRPLLLLCLLGAALGLLAGFRAVQAEEAPSAAPEPIAGIEPLSVGSAWDRNLAHLEALSGMGRAFVRSAPVAWGDIEPAPPRGEAPRYVWKDLDEAVLYWQLADLDPVLVLTPRSPWASAAREKSAWLATIEKRLSPEVAAGARRAATGLPPLRVDTWPLWERFVEDVVERYDGDGRKDMPGLRRGLRHIQVHDRAADPASWIGSEDEYLRLLHHAGLGARRASPLSRVLTTSVDVQATGHLPHPDQREWDYRIDQRVPNDAPLARLLLERSFSLLRRLLETPRLYDILPQRGADHVADDVANVGFLRRTLDAGPGAAVDVWLVESPTRKLGQAKTPAAVPPRKDELQRRRRWLPVAQNRSHSEHAAANAWMRRGQAFDVVRTLAQCRVAGADSVLFLAPDDDLPAGWPRAAERRGMGFVTAAASAAAGEEEPTATPLERTPSWYALRQALRWIAGHERAEEQPLGAPGGSFIFRFAARHQRPWVAVLLLDPRVSWAGEPGVALPERDVLVALPNGAYVLESCQTGPEQPARREVDVQDGSLLVKLGPAPLYIIPQR
jgi:hypothetical protein